MRLYLIDVFYVYAQDIVDHIALYLRIYLDAYNIKSLY